MNEYFGKTKLIVYIIAFGVFYSTVKSQSCPDIGLGNSIYVNNVISQGNILESWKALTNQSG